MKVLLQSHYNREKGYFIYEGEKKIIYYENFLNNNICPYIFNKNFIWTWCKYRRLEKGDIILWIDNKTCKGKYLIDIYFEVGEIKEWFYDNKKVYEKKIKKEFENYNFKEEILKRHFILGKKQHKNKRRKNYRTYFSTEDSFQPQDEKNDLIDIYPYFEKNHNGELEKIKSKPNGISFDLNNLNGFNFKNFEKWLKRQIKFKIYGKDIEKINVSDIIKI